MTYIKQCACGRLLHYDEKPESSHTCWRCSVNSNWFKYKRKLVKARMA